ncbi:MAG: type I restriction endonuclease subunit R [Bacteroidales bacterium]|nr:type I restriction endonuclease subunit R [Bacteroidales bacterium]
MPIKFTENSFENVVIEMFQNLGYDYLCGYDIDRDRRRAYYAEALESSLRRINKGLGDLAIKQLMERVRYIDGANLLQRNEIFMDMLQNGVSVEDLHSGEYRTVVARLVDFDDIDNNTFHVINQWTVEEHSNKRPDIVIFINGLPLVVIELKSPTSEQVKLEDAYNQIKNYQKEIPSLFSYNCFNVISNMAETRAGTITSSLERYMQWKTEDGIVESQSSVDYGTFFRGIFPKARLLDIIRNFICFNKDEDKTYKILAGYHQYFAVRKSLERTKAAIDNDGKIGVFWHTQGSGKSLSMVFFAHLLVRHFAETTIVVVTDRKDLDGQLYGQFARCKDFIRMAPQNAQSRQELISLLKDRKSGGIIFTTIQKFEESDEPLSLRKNIIVITDEAHRSQYGDERFDVKTQTTRKGMALKMREALPNASFIGFTGTPISSRDKSTIEVFGDYIDIYDMTQAVDDGATRPVYYESRVVKLNLDKDIVDQLDAEFDQLLDLGDTPEQVERAKRDVSRLEDVLCADETITSLVSDIIEHYENNRAQELTGKAMIVALTRKVGIRIYQKMLELRPEWKGKVEVVMTSSNKDPEEWQQIIGNESNRKMLAKRFKDDADPMKIAIVRDMWLTGFDVPSLATMYVFKAMSGHNLMQAIARVNRVFPGKEGGLIVDYIGIAQALKAAMRDYTQRDQQQFGDPNIAKTAYNKFLTELDICRDQIYGFNYQKFISGTDSDKAKVLTMGTDYMLDNNMEQKRKDFMEHSQLLHNSVTLCRSLLSREQKLEATFFDAVRVMILHISQSQNRIRKKEINDRISQLLQQSVKSDGVINLFSDIKHEFSLFDEKFMDELHKMKTKNIALELLKKLLKDKIQQFRRVNVVQSEKFSTLLQQCINGYVNGLITSKEALEELFNLVNDIKTQRDKGNDLGLNDEEKAFYDALSKPEIARQAYTDEQFIALTRELTECLRRNRTIDWNHKESARAQMRVMIKRLLKKYKYPPEGCDEALNTVMAQCDNWADNLDNFQTSDFETENTEYKMAAEDETDFK